MLRTTLALLAALTSLCMTSMADDANKKDKPQDVKKMMVTFITADVAKNTVTFKATDPSGKRTEIQLPLDKNVKVIGLMTSLNHFRNL